MKIIKQLRDMHEEATERFSRLEAEVNDILKPRVEANRWFFLGRLKELQSYALKVETGRFPDPRNLEDFFACTIVVPTISQIEDAEKLVLSLYDHQERRPPDPILTRKKSSSFEFDDLRLFVARRAATSGKNEDLTGLRFEVQIKTFLQYAWGIATHDLIYKTDSISWSRERVAYQMKAMLEHVDSAIAEGSRITDTQTVAKQDETTANILKIIDEVKEFWIEDQLPRDIKRLAETINDLLKGCSLKPDQLRTILEGEKTRIGGSVPVHLSPYAFTVQALAHSPVAKLEERFKAKAFRLVLHEDMELLDWMKVDNPRIINLR